LAILVGGSWTLYRFVLHKGFESALTIDCHVRTERCGDEFVVAFEVVLTNIGNRRLTAPPNLSKELDRGWKNPYVYPVDLQIKKIQASDAETESRFANWWHDESHLLTCVGGLPKHISLLDGYRKMSGRAEIIEFLMEPNERCTLANVFVLPSGHYIAKIVFEARERMSSGATHYIFMCLPVPVRQIDRVSLR